jgi:hypothetical protein
MPAVNHLVARNVAVEVSLTLATAVVLTAVTNADPAVASATAHGYANGDELVFTSTGMPRLDGQIARVSASAAGTFAIEGFDGVDAGTFVAGTAQKVGPWLPLAKAQTVSGGNSTANRQDAMVLQDVERNFVFGASESPELTVNGLSDLTSAGIKLIEKAARDNLLVNFRIRFIGQKQSRLLRAYVTTPGEDINVDQLVTSGFSMTQVGKRMAYVDAV